MASITKTDLVEMIAEGPLPKSVVSYVIDQLTVAIRACTADGDTVTLKGFGRFEQRARAARVGRNPQTGATVEIAASSRLAFKAAKN